MTEILRKSGRTAENSTMRAVALYEERRRHREKLYGRLIKVKNSFSADLISSTYFHRLMMKPEKRWIE